MSISESPEQTKQIAADLMRDLVSRAHAGPVIISLLGEYGVGKTQFVKGLATVLGIQSEIVSPSYVYMRNYPYVIEQGSGELVHIDAWRVKSEEDFKLLNLEVFLKPGAILVMEWPQNYAANLLQTLKQSEHPYTFVEVSLTELEGDRREIEINLPPAAQFEK